MTTRKIFRTRIARVRYKNGLTVHRFNDNAPPAGQPQLDYTRDWIDAIEDHYIEDAIVRGVYTVVFTDRDVYPMLTEDGSFPIVLLPAMVQKAMEELNSMLLFDTEDSDDDSG